MAEFFAMNGYGSYVWTSIGFSLLVLLLLGISSYFRHQNLLAKLAQIHLEEQLIAKAEQNNQGTTK